MKVCIKCKVDKPLEDFVLRKDSKDGRKGTCKLCSNARLQERRLGKLDEELKASRELRAKRAALPDSIGCCTACGIEFTVTCNGRSKCQPCVNKQHTEYYTNSVQQQEAKNKYYMENKTHIAEVHKAHYTENSEKYKAQQKINGPLWDKNNRGKRRAIFYKYYTKKLNATPPWISKEMLKEVEAFYIEAVRLTVETGIVHHVDHIMPLQGKTSSGLHVPWNLQVLTASENVSKGNRIYDVEVYGQ